VVELDKNETEKIRKDNCGVIFSKTILPIDIGTIMKLLVLDSNNYFLYILGEHKLKLLSLDSGGIQLIITTMVHIVVIHTRGVRAPVVPLCLSRVPGTQWLGIHLTKVHSAFHPYGVDKSNTSFGWGMAGNVRLCRVAGNSV
jgi:hypothetical protein